MTNVKTIIGAESKYVTDPRRMAIYSSLATNIKLKSALGAAVASNAAAFFTTHIVKQGASVALVGADTYATVCDVSGSGFMASVITNNWASASATTVSIRITVDGVEYLIEKTVTTASGERLLLGTFGQDVVTASSVYRNPITPGSYFDAGFTTVSDGVFTMSTLGLLTVDSILRGYSDQLLRFEDSLKVEVKTSIYSGSSPDEYAGVVYRLDL